MSNLWSGYEDHGVVYIRDPNGQTRLKTIWGDKEFARAMIHFLNGGSIHKLTYSDTEMDSMGIPKIT
jgi:hypothetical protein